MRVDSATAYYPCKQTNRKMKVSNRRKNRRLELAEMTCQEYLAKFPRRRKKPQYAMASISKAKFSPLRLPPAPEEKLSFLGKIVKIFRG